MLPRKIALKILYHCSLHSCFHTPTTLLNCFTVITARKRSCGKAMFSQLSVILFRGRRWPLPMMHWNMGTCTTDIWWSSLDTCSNLFTWGPNTPLPPAVVISTGGHWNMYSWQADGRHPTGMLSCFYVFTSCPTFQCRMWWCRYFR